MDDRQFKVFLEELEKMTSEFQKINYNLSDIADKINNITDNNNYTLYDVKRCLDDIEVAIENK